MNNVYRKDLFIFPFYAVLSAIGVLFATFYYFYYGVSTPSIPLLTGCALASLTFPMRKITGSLKIQSHYMISCLYFALFFTVYYTGGFFSPAIWWIVFIPVMSAFLLDEISTIVWGLLCLLFTLVISLTHLRVLPYQNTLQGFDLSVAYGLSGMTLVVSTGVLIIALKLRLYRFMEDRQFITDQNYILTNFTSLSQLSSSVAHEINNPLSIIIGHCDQIEKKASMLNDDEKDMFKYNIQKINTAVDRTIEIVKNLSFLTSRSQTVERLEYVRIHGLIEKIFRIHKNKFSLKNIDIHLSDQENYFETQVFSNETQLSQVLLNLLTNSFEALEDSDGGWIKVNYKRDKDFFYLHFTDSGHGVDPLLQDRIFRPLYSSKSQSPITNKGLGLSISKLIMNRMNGDVYLDKGQRNTTFVLKIPL